MAFRINRGVVALGLLMAAPAWAPAQAEHGRNPGAVVMTSTFFESRPAEEIRREIDDPATGDRWQLERNIEHPGGPGRMVLVVKGNAHQVRTASSDEPAGRGIATGAPAVPMVHAGDPLIVEEHTTLIDATLAAIALASASTGERLRVRLSIGGRVVDAVAVGPGRALLSPDSGAQP